jgi:hypothetical protein
VEKSSWASSVDFNKLLKENKPPPTSRKIANLVTLCPTRERLAQIFANSFDVSHRSKPIIFAQKVKRDACQQKDAIRLNRLWQRPMSKNQQNMPLSRVARFFSLILTKLDKNVPIKQQIYQMAISYTKCL